MYKTPNFFKKIKKDHFNKLLNKSFTEKDLILSRVNIQYYFNIITYFTNAFYAKSKQKNIFNRFYFLLRKNSIFKLMNEKKN